jgi:hypothetical protein
MHDIFMHLGKVECGSTMSNQVSLKNEMKLNSSKGSRSGSVKLLYGVLSESTQNEQSEGNGPGYTRLHRKTYHLRGNMRMLDVGVAY